MIAPDPRTALDCCRASAVAELCARLSAADADLVHSLAAAAMPASESRAARLGERDRLIREAITPYAEWRETRAAEELAGELRRVAACPHALGERADLLRRILQLSGDRALGWRQIINIMNGCRGG